MINGLEENSIYTVTISAVNNQSNAINTTSGLTITTQEAGICSYKYIVAMLITDRIIVTMWNIYYFFEINRVILLGKEYNMVSSYQEIVLQYSAIEVLFSFIAPSKPPVIVMSPTFSSRSITVNWNEIPCIQRNGRIIRYEVEFGPSGGVTTSMISGRSFTASGLTPFTNYTFQVRGVNSADPGPYSDLINITTSEDGI